MYVEEIGETSTEMFWKYETIEHAENEISGKGYDELSKFRITVI